MILLGYKKNTYMVNLLGKIIIIIIIVIIIFITNHFWRQKLGHKDLISERHVLLSRSLNCGDFHLNLQSSN